LWICENILMHEFFDILILNSNWFLKGFYRANNWWVFVVLTWEKTIISKCSYLLSNLMELKLIPKHRLSLFFFSVIASSLDYLWRSFIGDEEAVIVLEMCWSFFLRSSRPARSSRPIADAGLRGEYFLRFSLIASSTPFFFNLFSILEAKVALRISPRIDSYVCNGETIWTILFFERSFFTCSFGNWLFE